MTGISFATASLVSYGIAAAGYLALALRMAVGLSGGRRGALLFAAVLLTAVWALLGAWVGRTPAREAMLAFNVAETLRYGVWFAFVLALLAGGAKDRPASAGPPAPYWVIGLGLVLLVASVALSETLPSARLLDADAQRPEFGVRLGLAIAGLVVAEQLFRRVHAQARWGIKPLALALAAVFGFDLFLYADALLLGRIDADVWVARGIANALVIPLIAVATARNAGWTIEMHLSREAVFQSSALLVSGLFLLAVAGAGYIVRYFGGDWGRALQIELLFAAAVLMVLVASSGRFRSRLKVFVSKHFFSYRYDYREEWLRFTRTLSTDSPVLGHQERAIMALADLVESPGGALWLQDERAGFRPAARLNMPPVEVAIPREAPLARFLERTGWVIALEDARRRPSEYPELEVPARIAEAPLAWLVVPLTTGTSLIGFVLLQNPRSPIEVDWEVRDLLKAAARAAGAYLQQIQMTEALLEVRKFDAFNRMSAFVVHDLKNLVTQLSLMLKNAERHRDNPEFQRDMLDTVANVVARMNALMLQLRTGSTPVENPRPVDLVPIVERVCAAKSTTGREVGLALPPSALVLGHDERLEHVIGHLVQNALDATANGGRVQLGLASEPGRFRLEVADDGVGMSPAFQRERLFKPFQTTKPAGMGIGVYESQQYVHALGGRIDVDSREGAGTRVTVSLPAADPSLSPGKSLEETA